MKKNPLNHGLIGENLTGIVHVTRAMVHERARELALIAGHEPQCVTQADYEQAKREVTGESDMDRQDAILDALPEKERRDPVPGSSGIQVPDVPAKTRMKSGEAKSGTSSRNAQSKPNLTKCSRPPLPPGKERPLAVRSDPSQYSRKSA